MTTLAVSEVFGPTLQGEGPNIGRPAAFLRVAGCNLTCSWCDTSYTWDWSRWDRDQEVHVLPIDEVARRVLVSLPQLTNELRLLVVSGGEPMLQQTSLAQLMEHLPLLAVEVETAGTRVPLDAWDQWVDGYNVSLKLAHSGNGPRRINPEAIHALNLSGKATWKFVAQGARDLVEVEDLVDQHNLRGPVYIMPEGTDSEVLRERAQLLAPHVIERGWHLTPRLQIDLWGKARGH